MNNIVYTIKALPEDMPVRGNAMASGDAALDREVEDRIIAELDAGNEWAWCIVKVTAMHPDLKDVVGVAHLSGCSYDSYHDFVMTSGYVDQLKRDALDDLRDALARAVKRAEIAGRCLLEINGPPRSAPELDPATEPGAKQIG